MYGWAVGFAWSAFIERLAYRPLRNGLSGNDAWPWALFWGLYIGLFVGPVVEARTRLTARARFVVTAAVSCFVALIPVLSVVFNRVVGKRGCARRAIA